MVHLCTDVIAASWMLELFGEVGGDVPEYFLLDKIFEKMTGYKVIAIN